MEFETGTIQSTLLKSYISRHYFVMGRITKMPDKDLTKEDLLEFLFSHKLSSVVAEEKGDITGKLHFHFVCLGKRDTYSNPKAFMETVRKHIKKQYDLKGNEEYSLKMIEKDPINACAYVIKDNNYSQEGIDVFFLTTYALALIHGTAYQ